MVGLRRKEVLCMRAEKEKRYFRIGELAKLLMISRHSLISLEREGVIRPERTLTNQRIYPEEVICKICDYYKQRNGSSEEEDGGEGDKGKEWVC
jgi:DNA-binding XRE family transcriptional regulator